MGAEGYGMSLMKTALRASSLGLLSLALVLSSILAMVPMTANHSAVADSSGTTLVSESFGGTQVGSSRFIPLGDACLTNAPRPPVAAGNGTQLKGCSKTNQTPGIAADPSQGGWLQFTDVSNNTSGGVVYNQAIPSQYGVDVTFDQAQYGGSGADGIGFFLTDGSYNLTKTGATGGSMGYAPKIGTGATTDAPGAVGGFIGLALDRYGNFQRAAEGRGQGCAAAGENPGISGNVVSDSVTLRGPGGNLLTDGTRDKDWNSGYCLLSTKKLTDVKSGATLASGTSNPVSVHITVTAPDANNSVVVTVQLKMSGDSDYTTYLTTTVSNAPSSYKLGFSGATGGLTDVHLIRNLDIKTIRALPSLSLVKQVDSSSPNAKSVYDSGDTVPYSFVVTNGGIEDLHGITVNDPLVTNVTCAATILAPSASTTCTGTHILTAAEAAPGSFRNVATATGQNVDGVSVTSDESEAIVPTARDTNLLVCTAGTVYSQNSGGQVRAVTSTGSTQAFTFAGSGGAPTNSTNWNGLGISENGQYAYSYVRSQPSGSNQPYSTATIYQRNLATQTTTRVANNYATGISSSLVGGAVDLSTGNYVFGGPTTVGTSNRFALFAYIPSANDPSTGTTKAIGYVPIPTANVNGDLAFDALGNLYLVVSSSVSGQATTLYSVTSAQIVAGYASTNGSQLSLTPTIISTTTSWPTSGNNNNSINGVAFSTDGTLFLGTSSSVYLSDFASFSRDTSWTLSSSTDLATCASPPTVTVQKDVSSRFNDTDQFSVSASRSGTVLGTGTTTGSDLGVQNASDEQAGPALAASNQTIAFSETGASGANLANYDSSWDCVDQSNQTVINASGTGTGGSIIVPKPASWANGLDLVCTITNTAKPHPATVTIEKSVQDVNGNPIASTDFDGTQVKQGWPMAAALSDNAPAGVQISGATVQNTDQNGKVAGWTVTFPSGVANTSVNVTETQGSLPGYAFNNLQCQVNSGSFGSVSATQGTGANTNKVTGAVDIAPGDTVLCRFTNKQQPGSVTWSKVADDSSQTKLAGSQWQLTYPDGSTKTIKDSSESGSNNAAAAGDPYGFKVSDLPWGAYTLVETKAPVGYVLPDATLPANQHTFTVSGATALEKNFSDPFINQQQTVPNLPLTGGTSADAYLMAGAILLMLSCALGIIGVRRRKGDAKRH